MTSSNKTQSILTTTTCSCSRCRDEWTSALAFVPPTQKESCGKSVRCDMCHDPSHIVYLKGTKGRCLHCVYFERIPKCGEKFLAVPTCVERTELDRDGRRKVSDNKTRTKCTCTDPNCDLCGIIPWCTSYINPECLHDLEGLDIDSKKVKKGLAFGLRIIEYTKICKTCVQRHNERKH
jgi:hypothetical protein